MAERGNDSRNTGNEAVERMGGEWDAQEFDRKLFDDVLEDTRWENRLPVEDADEYGLNGPMPGV